MSAEVHTAKTTDVVGPLRDLMLQRAIHSVPILDTNGTLAGIVTSSDLIEEWPPQMGVQTVMTARSKRSLDIVRWSTAREPWSTSVFIISW
jgi:CBS-domain-containing membrane protein